MMSISPEPKPTPRRVWPRVVLVVSLALNLLFVGLILGAVARHGGPDGRRGPPSIGAALYRALPQEDRKELRDESHSLRDHKQRAERDLAALQQVAATLRATPFDAQALSGMVNRDLDQRRGELAAMQAAWLQKIEQMSDAERRAYADRLLEVFTQRKEGWFKRDRD